MSEATAQQTPEITGFCADEDGRYRISKPWVKDGWRYATDGRVAVRLPAEGEPDEPQPEGPGTRLPDASDWFGEQYEFKADLCTEPFPPHDGRTIKQTCDNEAHMKDCQECNGTGTCWCPKCEHPHDCPKCHGEGVDRRSQTRCPECNSFGYGNHPAPQVIAGKRIQGTIAVRIAELPGARYYSDGHAGRPLHFVAAGGLEGVASIICNSEERESGKLKAGEPAI